MISVFEFTNTKLSYNDKFIYKCIFDLTSHIVSKKTGSDWLTESHSFLFTLLRQKNVCNPGDEAIMKIHKKLFSGIGESWGMANTFL